MELKLQPDLERDISLNSEIINLLEDIEIAKDFYRALCNMRWKKEDHFSNDEKIIEKLKGNEDDIWSCTWRYAGGMISQLRNKYYNTEENYLDFYCSGNEGYVSDEVEEYFNSMGWVKCPWDDFDEIEQ